MALTYPPPIRVQSSPDGGGLSPESKAVFLMGTLNRDLDVRPFQGEAVLSGTESLEPDAIVVGTVEVLRTHWNQQGIAGPLDMDYPASLVPFLGREIWESTLGEARRWPFEVFVKPRACKAFEAGFLNPAQRADEWPGAGWPDTTPIWISQGFDPHAEYRVYLKQGGIVGVARYDPNDESPPDDLDMEVVQAAIAAWSYCPRDPMPAGCALDFAVDGRGATLLVEATDGWAIGYYPKLEREAYLDLLVARQQEIIGHRSGN
ncbi:ATP-grasp domain-containing protein [Thioalkalivibrio sp. ALE16]|uniref:ATP-grasp domain-containing protein n=1 Tax=Thioalkalivibrio sp. ALE16 TaxID=1158172 RepID=UPI00035F373E|nr:ATP-grasp domain-containing protein [Thioalkalivibrio sp. ALE16]